MKLVLKVGGKRRELDIALEGSRLVCRIDGRAVEADAVEVGRGTYSILMDGAVFEVRIQPAADGLRVHAGGQEFTARVIDRRAWKGRHSGTSEAEGRQQVTAPMPGKVVRVLIKQGDAVEAGQGLVVVEAMKMQNEIRSPRSGMVERLLVSEGKAVSAGEVLALVG